MKTIFLFFLVSISIAIHAQDYQKMAKDLQLKYKESQVAILQASYQYEFIKDAKVAAKIAETKSRKLLSLRYNYSLPQTEVYDNNSFIEKFYGESNLKQKASDGTQICGTYTSEGYFFDDSKFCSHLLKLKEVGEVWNLNLVKKINDPKYLTSIYFQEKFPSLQKVITFIIPQDVDVEIKEFNFAGFDITRTEKKTDGNSVIEYVSKNLNGMESENMERGLQFNHPHLLILVKSAIVAGKKINALSNTEDLYAWCSSLTKQLKPKSQVFKPTVDELIKNKKTDEDKIKAIYYWVQDNIRYIAFEDGIAGFKPDEAHNVFEKRYGDCKGMANLTKEMLKAAGFDARLTWIGTKRIMYDHPIPSLAVNNHMICTVFLSGKKYYLDATEKYIPFGENAERIQNRSVMIEDGDHFIIDKINESDKNHDQDLRVITATINGDNLEGKYVIDLKGEAKKNFLYSYNYTKSDLRKDFLSDFISVHNKNLKPVDVKLPNLEERSGDLALECGFTYTGAVSSFNNEYYVDIDPTKHFKNWEIKDTRQSDIDFGEKIYRKSAIELNIPAGYSVSNLPGNVSISDADFLFNINYKQVGNKIVYTKELSIPQGIIKKTSFPQWNEAVKKLNKAYEDQIILKK
jgi:hypothetical protein